MPTLIFRHDFPEEWQFVLVMDERAKGINGIEEIEAFNTLPDMSSEASAEICQQVLMQMLPSIIERDCGQFGASVSRIQARIGEYFSAAQGGLFASDNVKRTLEFLLENKATGVSARHPGGRPGLPYSRTRNRLCRPWTILPGGILR